MVQATGETDANDGAVTDALRVVPSDHGERHRWMALILRASIAIQVMTMRLSRDWTQEELAEKSGLSFATVNRLENPSGEPPAMKTLLAVAKAFDCALFCGFEDWNDFVRHMAGIIPPRPYSSDELRHRLDDSPSPHPTGEDGNG